MFNSKKKQMIAGILRDLEILAGEASSTTERLDEASRLILEWASDEPGIAADAEVAAEILEEGYDPGHRAAHYLEHGVDHAEAVEIIEDGWHGTE